MRLVWVSQPGCWVLWAGIVWIFKNKTLFQSVQLFSVIVLIDLFLSLLTFSFICWLHSLSVKDGSSLNDVVQICSRITGVKHGGLSSLCDQQIVRKSMSILKLLEWIMCELSLLSCHHLFPSAICFLIILYAFIYVFIAGNSTHVSL